MSAVMNISRKHDCSEAEWATRVELAALYRLFVHYGWTDLTKTHISARLADQPNCYLLNPYGLMFDEIHASNLLKVTFDGEVVAGDYPYINAGHLIHSSVLKARPDLNFVLHSHTRAGVAVSAMQGGLRPYSQHAMTVLGTLSTHPYQDVDESDDECELLGLDLADNFVMILENHGLLACGRTAAEAFLYHYYTEMACKVQVDILQSGVPTILPAQKAVQDVMDWGKPGAEPHGSQDWPALLRLLDRKDPTYKD